MNNLDWTMLAEKYYDFAAEARKHGFYVEELNRMEDSLYEMRPYKVGGDKHEHE